jgi:hypothetical protein
LGRQAVVPSLVLNSYCHFLPWTLRFRKPFLLFYTLHDGRSVGIVRSRTKGHGVCLFVCFYTLHDDNLGLDLVLLKFL